MKHFDYAIIGGGVAGLCAAKRFLDMDISPLVIEAGGYPSHKVCGEFISPSSLPILKKWGIEPVPIHHIHLHTPTQHLNFPLLKPAAALSHLTLDVQLADQIVQQGATLLTHTKVLHLIPASRPGEFHHLTLSTNEEIRVKHLLIAAGRLPQFSKQALSPQYIGIKAHFCHLELQSSLHMFSFKDAYLGITPIEDGKANLACLAKIEHVQQFSSSQDFIQTLISSHPFLKRLLAPGHSLFEKWMEVYVPEFGLRQTPNWIQTYWIGDAAGTIPPASGNGLSLALASGYIAANFAKKNDAVGFKKAWKKRCIWQIRAAKFLHRCFLNPKWSSTALYFNHQFPWITNKIFDLTRDPGL